MGRADQREFTIVRGQAGSHVHDRFTAPSVPRAAGEAYAPVISNAGLARDTGGPHREYLLT